MLGLLIIPILVSCSNTQKVDYNSATAVETALNKGKNVDNKTFKMKVEKVIPNGELGYTLWGGKHLNIIKDENPKATIKKGDTVIVKVDKAKSALGSWIIQAKSITK